MEHPNVIWEMYGNRNKIMSTYDLWSILVLQQKNFDYK